MNRTPFVGNLLPALTFIRLDMTNVAIYLKTQQATLPMKLENLTDTAVTIKNQKKWKFSVET